MFVIKPDNGADWQNAFFILSSYRISLSAMSDKDDESTTYVIVDAIDDDGHTYDYDKHQEELRLAEMAFQMSWRQVGRVCTFCEDTEDVCGHLTFNKPMKPAF